MSKTLRVSGAALTPIDDNTVELSALIGDERLWYRLPAEHMPALRGDLFAIVGLLPAMRLGVPLEIDPALGVDPVLLQNFDQLQKIFRLWGPSLGQPYRQVPVIARPEPATTRGKVMSFFSGGVDGTYTLLQAPEKIEQAVFVSGVDFQLDNPVYRQAFDRNAAWLAERGIPLISMSSNVRFVGRALGLNWAAMLGPGLASFAHVLQAKTMYLAAGHTWKESWPDASHPLTDPMLSSSAIRIVHHGREATRGDKILRISKEPGALDILRVCWQDKEDYNCGRCEKCIRTMVLLRLLGLKSPNFPELKDLSLVSRFVPGDRSESVFVEEAIVLADRAGDKALGDALRKSLARWEWRSLISDVDKAWLGGFLHGVLGKAKV